MRPVAQGDFGPFLGRSVTVRQQIHVFGCVFPGQPAGKAKDPDPARLNKTHHG